MEASLNLFAIFGKKKKETQQKILFGYLCILSKW